MSKQVKNKKGKVAKSALSVALAASMVVSSSAFVYASPVVEEVSPADVQLEAPAVIGEESIGAVADQYTITSPNLVITTDAPIKYGENATTSVLDAIKSATFSRTLNGNPLSDLTVAEAINAPHYYTVKVSGAGKEVILTSSTVATDLPHAVGTYTVTVTGTNNVVVDGNNTETSAHGSTSGTYYIVDDKDSDNIKASFENQGNIIFTGDKIEPKLTLKQNYSDSDDTIATTLVEGTDYKIIGYYENIGVCDGTSADTSAYVFVEYMNNYVARGQVKYPFAIKAADISDANIKATISNKPVYNGKVQKPELKVEYTPTGSTFTKTLTEGTDYTVAIKSRPTNFDSSEDVDYQTAGKYVLTITGINNYKTAGTKDVDYIIEQQNFDENTLEVTVPDVIYKGETPVAPVPVVKFKGTDTEVPSTEYDVYFAKENGTYVSDAFGNEIGKTYGIRLTPKGKNFKSGKILSTYKVVQLGDSLQDYLAKNSITFEQGSDYSTNNEYEYDKEGIVPNSVKINGEIFNSNGIITGDGGEHHNDLKLEFPKKEDCKKVGTYEIKVIGQGKWADQSATIQFKIKAKDMEDAPIYDLSSNTPDVEATDIQLHKTHANDLTTSLAIKDDNYQLINGEDYSYVIKKENSAYKIYLTFKGNYSGEKIINAIAAGSEISVPLNSDAIEATVKGEYKYTGAPIRPTIDNIVLKESNGNELKAGYDFKIVEGVGGYGENIKVGKGTINIIAIGGAYSGTRTLEFDIQGGEIVKDNYSFDTTALKAVYELGSTIDPESDIKVKTTTGRTLAPSEYDVKYYRDGKELNKSDANAKAGTVSMEVTIKDTKTKFTASYRIATSLDKVTTIPNFNDASYTGTAIEQEIKLIVKNTTLELVKDKDYTVKYENNINVGTAMVTIEGIGDYYGTYTKTFKITPVELKGEIVLESDKVTLAEGGAKPVITVKDDKGNVIAASDYTVSYKDNDKAGTATVIVTGNGNYKGTLEKTFTVVEGKLSIPVFQETALKARNTNANTYVLDVKGAAGTLSYSSNKESIATVDAEGRISFKHKVGNATITVKDSATGKTLKVAVKVIPATPTIKVTAADNAFKVTASKVKDAGGYQIAYATKEDFSNQKKIAVKTTSKMTNKTVKAGNKVSYNVKVRAFKKVSGKYVFGKWSTVKVVKTK